jgi:ubiquinone biosynthesis UbiH/UbiF/VisC/COQ6 family hydroxylase
VSFHICIHGTGFVGQTLALHLAKNGFRVALLATQPPSQPSPTSPPSPAPVDIRAFALNAASKTLLEAVGAWPSGTAVTPVRAMAVQGDLNGRLEFDCPARAEALNWIVDVPALASLLSEQVAGEPRIACLASQDAPQAALHVVCEGRHSQLRTQLGIEAETIVYPQHAIATRLVCERPHEHIARQWFNERGEVLALLPLGGSGDSEGSEGSKATALHEVALVWSLTSSRAKEMMALAPADFCTALQAACSQALGAMSLASPLALWPLQLIRLQQWSGELKQPEKPAQHWVLAGDAAHAVHPLAGQGLNLGLGDARALALALTALQSAAGAFRPAPSKLLPTLRCYARERQAAASAVAATTDGLHLLFANGNPATQQLRNWGMNALNYLSPLKNLLIRKAQ